MKLSDNEVKSFRDDEDKGRAAAEVLANPLVAGALKRLLDESVSAWVSTLPSDYETREHLYNYVRALERFKADFLATIQAGEDASAYLENNAH